MRRSVDGMLRRGSAFTKRSFRVGQGWHDNACWRRRTGIEPARPSYLVSSVLKTAGTTRNPNASKKSNYHVCHAAASLHARLFCTLDRTRGSCYSAFMQRAHVREFHDDDLDAIVRLWERANSAGPPTVVLVPGGNGSCPAGLGLGGHRIHRVNGASFQP